MQKTEKEKIERKKEWEIKKRKTDRAFRLLQLQYMGLTKHLHVQREREKEKFKWGDCFTSLVVL